MAYSFVILGEAVPNSTTTFVNATDVVFESVLVVDFEVNAGNTVISGADFAPPIDFSPGNYRALQTVGDDIIDVSDLIEKFEKNGDYYDVVLTEIDQERLNVKISVQ